jgi:hypothetical protein
MAVLFHPSAGVWGNGAPEAAPAVGGSIDNTLQLSPAAECVAPEELACHASDGRVDANATLAIDAADDPDGGRFCGFACGVCFYFGRLCPICNSRLCGG